MHKIRSIEDVVAEISNLAQEIKFFDLLTYVFVTRALALELLRTNLVKNPDALQNALNATRGIDSAVVNAIRQLYPFLLSLETEEGVQVGEQVLRIIYEIERVQLELDRLILEEGAKSRVDKVYEELLKTLIKSMLASSCLLYTSPSPRDPSTSRMPSSA